MRDKEIRWAKEDEEMRREEERQAALWGCIGKLMVIGCGIFVLLMALGTK